MKGTVIVLPVLGRPHRVEPLLASIAASTPEPHRVLFVCSSHDQPMRDAVTAAGAQHLAVDYQEHGDYARKVNTAYQATTEPLLFLGADDLRFHLGWLSAAAARMTGEVGVVGTNDLGNRRVMRGEHATHSLVSRSYIDVHGTIDESGKVLHEGYPHEYVDDELVGTAKRRHAWAFAADSIVEHLHPHWHKAPTDALYDAEPERMRIGRPIFEKRRRLWM